MKKSKLFSGSFKTLSAAMIVMGAATTLIHAQAGDRLNLTPALLSEVRQIPNGKDNLRVYVSHNLKITRSNSQATRTTEVEREIRRAGHDRMLIEKIADDASGMIVGPIDGETLEVAFDRACVSKPGPHCTFSFTRLSHGTSEYYLSRVPYNQVYSAPEIKRYGGWGATTLKRVYSHDDGINIIQSKNKDRVTLQVVLSEMRDMQVDRRRYNGVD